MKRLGILILLLLFILSGCQDTPVVNPLGAKIDEFENTQNQFQMSITIDLDITQNNQTETISECINGLVQKEPYYALITAGDITVVEQIEDNILKTYTMDNNHVVNGVQLYNYQEVAMDLMSAPLSNLEFDLSNVDIETITENEYKISGKLIDFMPEAMLDDLKDVLLISGLSEEEFNNISIELISKFGEDSFEYSFLMGLNISNIDIELRLNALFKYYSFERLDFSDQTKYYPTTSNEGDILIDINYPIVFIAENYEMSQYYAYFEAGNYGLISNNNDEYHTIFIHDEDRDTSKLRVFNDVYNQYLVNPNNISRYYNIPSDGYYYISIDYPPSPNPYVIEVRKIESITDGIQSPSLTVTESGSYNYNIESEYDFFSIDFDLDQEAIISIFDANQNQLYKNTANVNYFNSIEIPENGMNYYVNDTNQLVYLHNPEGVSSGTLTIEITPIVHLTNPYGSMLEMKDYFTDEFIIAKNQVPNQYVAIEVTERKEYTFEYLMKSGELNDAKGSIYDIDGRFISNIYHERSIILVPGSYYYKSINDYDVIYSIKYSIADAAEIIYHIDVLQSYDLLTGNLLSKPHFEGRILQLGEIITYEFSLLETTDVAFQQDRNMFELYDSNDKRIDIINQDSIFVYRLPAGDYYVTVSCPYDYDESNFPVNYLLNLYKFTGGEHDTSVYPFTEEIIFGFGGKTSSIDYTGDYDGYTFTITETTTLTISSSVDAYLLLGNRIIRSRIEREDLTLQPGTYTIMCSTHETTWTVRIMKT